MKTLNGITAASGLAIGLCCQYTDRTDESIPHYVIDGKDIDGELSRLKEAYEKTKDTLKKVLESSKEILGNESAEDIIKAHEMILEDGVLYGRIESLIKEKRINVEHAVSDAFGEYVEKFGEKKLHFAELTHDIIDVRNRVLSSFDNSRGHFECQVGSKESVVVVSKRLTPSIVLNISKKQVLAFVTEEGGFTTHATILARALGVPIVFGIDVGSDINCGDRVIVDGSLGKVIIDPDKETEEYYKKKIDDWARKRAVCEIRKDEPTRTKVGKRISLKVNISRPEEMELVKGANHDGVGLLRTEFLFMDGGLTGQESPPSEDEQYTMYLRVIEESGKSVTVRLLDIGGDKLPGYLTLPQQKNPDLGIRGARALDLFHDVYLTQVKAILRSSAHGDIRILLPMISDTNDLASFNRMLDEAMNILRKEGKPFNKKIKKGVMIETPAAALMADELLEKADFANIGSNDLLQYTLAAERGNVFVEKRYHVAHPALMRLIEIIVGAAEKHNKELCLCGEISSFEEFYPLFLSLGLKSFSVSAAKFDDIKCALLHEKRLAKAQVKKYFASVTKEEIDKFFGK